MRESMMKNQVTVCTQMNKLVLLIPLFFITMCGEAPVTPPAQACSPRLDGEPTFCPPFDGDLPPKPKPLIPRQELKGEIDIYEPMHWHQMQMMFQRNARRTRMEPVSYTHLTLPTKA